MVAEVEAASLLLLPALLPHSKPASFRAAYRPSFEALLPRLASGFNAQAVTTTRLDVGLVLSPSYPVHGAASSRSSMFSAVQELLAKTYSLICTVAAQAHVELDFPGGVDVRLFLLELRVDQLPPDVRGKQAVSGPIIDLATFVSSSRHYSTIYSTEGEVGEGYLKAVISEWQSTGKSAPPVQQVPGGPVIQEAQALGNLAVQAGRERSQIHKSVAVGGTFDHLHIGHKLLLTATVLVAEPDLSDKPNQRRQITVGITGDELLVNKKHAELVESWDERQRKTAEFVESILVFHPDVPSIRKVEHIHEPGPNGRVVRVSYAKDLTINYTLISDPYGPTITDKDITALVISNETRAGGKAVNDKRTEKGWKELEVFEVDVLDAGGNDGTGDESDAEEREKQSFENKISSTRIRRRLQERTQA